MGSWIQFGVYWTCQHSYVNNKKKLIQRGRKQGNRCWWDAQGKRGEGVRKEMFKSSNALETQSPGEEKIESKGKREDKESMHWKQRRKTKCKCWFKLLSSLSLRPPTTFSSAFFPSLILSSVSFSRYTLLYVHYCLPLSLILHSFVLSLPLLYSKSLESKPLE